MKKIYVIILLLIAGIIPSKAQDISPPELLNATVVNDDGDVKLTWNLTDTLDVDIQILRDLLEINAYDDIHIIKDTSIITWTDMSSGANEKPRSYMLKYNLDGSPSSNKFNTIHTTLDFDTCKKTINLKWTRHVPSSKWINFNDTLSIKHYNVWKKIDDGNYTKIHTTTDTSFTDEDVNYNDSLKYYIEAVRTADTSLKSKSNRVSKFTRMPYNPDFINPDIVKTENNKINLQYTIAKNSALTKYKLLRSDAYNGQYDTINTFNTDENTLTYTDSEASPSRNIYYYYVASINQCNQLTTKSDTANNLRLQLNSDNETALLSWNEFSLASQNITYEINRKNGTNPYEYLAKVYSTNYTDNQLNFFSGRDSSGKFCYYTVAKTHINEGQTSKSISNKSCIYIKPQVFVPNAFTPNGDGKNETFRPFLSFLPQDYRLIIYNRRGNKVFETTSPEKSWKGRFKGQHKVQAGTYIYYLEAKNPKQETIKKRGEINVLYP
jgi:gliding motility-associated-like protein